MNTIVKKAHGSKEIAKAIYEMAQDGYVLTSYSLPNLTFSEDGERVEFSYALQSLVEEQIAMLKENKNRVINTDLLGLVDLYNKKMPKNTTGELRVSIDSLNNIAFVVVTKTDIKVPELPPSKLKNIIKILKETCVKNDNYRSACMSIVSKIYKLQKVGV